jgi:hypothetical protein
MFYITFFNFETLNIFNDSTYINKREESEK